MRAIIVLGGGRAELSHHRERGDAWLLDDAHDEHMMSV